LLGALNVALVLDVFVEVYEFAEVLLLRVHIFPACEHELAQHSTATSSNYLLVKAQRQFMSGLFDGTVARDRAPLWRQMREIRFWPKLSKSRRGELRGFR
jgi:hypothetical protein